MNSGLWFWAPVYQDALAAVSTGSRVYMYSWDWKKAGGFYDPTTNFTWTGLRIFSDILRRV